jgi:hypothetical protein
MVSRPAEERDHRRRWDLSHIYAAENARIRARCKANVELCALLLEDANRRGKSEINWTEYFQNLDVNYP